MTKKKDAFTLIELIMIITIISILAVVVTVSIPTSPKLSGVANKLMFDLRYAQQLAISRGGTSGVSFDPFNNSYFVYIGDTATIATDPHTHQDLSIDYDTDRDYAGVVLSNTNFGDRISFNYLGAPFDSNDTALSIPGAVTLQYGSNTQDVTIETDTGGVKIQ